MTPGAPHAAGTTVSLGGPPSGGPFRCYRVGDGRFPLLDGAGAARFGGRWNSPGRAVVYGSLSYATALLELLVHRGRARVPAAGYVWVTLDVPAGVRIEVVEPAKLPGWNARDHATARRVGDEWLAARRTPALLVPSLRGVPHEWNVLLNPGHAEFARVVAGEAHIVEWDARVTGSAGRRE